MRYIVSRLQNTLTPVSMVTPIDQNSVNATKSQAKHAENNFYKSIFLFLLKVK